MFGVPKYSDTLVQVAKKYNVGVTFKHNLVEVTKDKAIFENFETKEKIEKSYDFLHVVPPMSPHAFLKESGLTNEAGFVDVDKHTLRHNKYPNIWALGDCSSLPCSKTAAAVFSQTMVLLKYIFVLFKATY
jgi:NADPH-dependent 2,4-dienoyl-CoA reductase/sulfur reductase-like enzyme